MTTPAGVWEKMDINGKKISKHKHPNSPPCHYEPIYTSTTMRLCFGRGNVFQQL